MQYKAKVNITTYSKWIKLNMEEGVDENVKVVTLDYKAKTVSIFIDKSYSDVMKIDYDDLLDMYDSIIAELSKIKKSETPPLIITVKGKEFEFIKDITKLTVGQAMDIKKFGKEILDRPAYMMAVLHTPVGHKMERKEMEELFKEHYPLSKYIVIFDFFFQKYIEWSRAISLLQEIRMNEMRIQKVKLIGTRSQRVSMRFRSFFVVTWMMLQGCFMYLFYIGKNLPSNIRMRLRGMRKKGKV
jgi:hypothetical protein